jgi:putative copper export protein
MSVLDWILVVIRWSHLLAAVAWVGGGMFYLLVLRPGLRRKPASTETHRAIGAEFRDLVTTAIAILLLTGVILSISRLTESTITIPYVAVLAVKIGLALYMFYLVRFLRRRAYPEEPIGEGAGWTKLRHKLTGTTAVLITGVVVFGLSDVLAALFEHSLR